jgi:hypothetical protein
VLDSLKLEGFQDLTIMELALLITTPGLVHIFEEIINQMDTKSLVASSLVCKDWWKVIQNHPKRWRCIIRKICIKEALIYPDFRKGQLISKCPFVPRPSTGRKIF